MTPYPWSQYTVWCSNPHTAYPVWASQHGQFQVFLLSSDSKHYHSLWLWQRSLGLQQLPHPVAFLFRVNPLWVLFPHTIGLLMVEMLGLSWGHSSPTMHQDSSTLHAEGTAADNGRHVKCFLQLLSSNYCWQLGFLPLFTLWVKRELYWNQDKTENLAFLITSRIWLRVESEQNPKKL